MSLVDNEERPIFIKKIPPPPPPAHGGAWKVAYADFVTAMMAFFLLLWLLNATSDDQKQGISNYFEPTGETKGSSGSGGMFGGISMTDPGIEKKPGPTQEMRVGTDAQVSNELKNQTRQVKKHDKPKNASPAEVERELKELKQAERAIKQALFDIPQLTALKDSMKVEIRDEGLHIQLIDQEGKPLFLTGSSQMTDRAQKLMRLTAKIIDSMPNKITISGHTDSEPLNGGEGRTNWELSLDRANSARRELLSHNVSSNRIESVAGLADKAPLHANKPTDPQNRRISIILLREKRKVKKAAPPRPPRVL